MKGHGRFHFHFVSYLFVKKNPMQITPDIDTFPTRHWHALDDSRLHCDVCPRACELHEGQRGLCFVRGRSGDQVVLTTYGRANGFRADPIEKKPLYHFLPGSRTLSFGTAGVRSVAVTAGYISPGAREEGQCLECGTRCAGRFPMGGT
jgi:hypothetical protein